MSKIQELSESALGLAIMGLYILSGIGSLYWLWIAIQIGSFSMFVVGIIPITIIITGPVGAWSILFGVPDWIYDIFG